MRKYLTYFLGFLLFSGCSKEKGSTEYKEGETTSKEVSFSELDIPDQWIEISKGENGEWIFIKPCEKERELRTFKLYKVDSQEAIYCYFGTEGQWFAIKKIWSRGDNLTFNAVLPYDTFSIATFTMKFIDRERKITEWTGEGMDYTYIPIQDTIKFRKITQSCETEK